MAKRGGQLREFTPDQVKTMVDLFNQGVSVGRIGKAQVPPTHHTVVSRVLTPILGPLRAARRRVRQEARKDAQAEEGDMDFRERYHAGYRMALTHVALHGLEAAHEHCGGALLYWREHGEENDDPSVPPLFWRTT